jgi:hypothetical protein
MYARASSLLKRSSLSLLLRVHTHRFLYESRSHRRRYDVVRVLAGRVRRDRSLEHECVEESDRRRRLVAAPDDAAADSDEQAVHTAAHLAAA